jgi:hypothetical protein
MTDLIALILIGIYLGGIWKFWTGYRYTTFSRRLPTRLVLSYLWPILLMANGSYRRNFTKALKGTRDD